MGYCSVANPYLESTRIFIVTLSQFRKVLMVSPNFLARHVVVSSCNGSATYIGYPNHRYGPDQNEYPFIHNLRYRARKYFHMDERPPGEVGVTVA